MSGDRPSCKICGSFSLLVRDHNHRTGFFRGILCQLCNNWLGLYEANLDRNVLGIKPLGKGRYRKWVSVNEVAIIEHLKTETNLKMKDVKKVWKQSLSDNSGTNIQLRGTNRALDWMPSTDRNCPT